MNNIEINLSKRHFCKVENGNSLNETEYLNDYINGIVNPLKLELLDFYENKRIEFNIYDINVYNENLDEKVFDYIFKIINHRYYSLNIFLNKVFYNKLIINKRLFKDRILFIEILDETDKSTLYLDIIEKILKKEGYSGSTLVLCLREDESVIRNEYLKIDKYLVKKEL